MVGVMARIRVASGGCTSVRGLGCDNGDKIPRRGSALRSHSPVPPVLIAIAILGFALGGCGTLSSPVGTGLTEEDTLLQPPVPAEPAPGALAGAPAETEPAGTVVTYEPITAENAPAWAIALSGPTDTSLRGTPDVIPPESDVEEYDPWEKFNEKMFSFNYHMDKWVLKPTAKGYNAVVPDMFQTMIDNAFTNLRMPVRFVNKVLQWKLLGATKEMARFLINSTLGIGGLFDVARQEMGLEEQKADFGQTLGIWGLGPGPYLVLPFLPPLTARDGIGYGVDGTMNILNYYIPFFPDQFGMSALQTINERSLNLDLFQGIEEATLDLYSSVRNAYLQRRNRMIKDGY
jgi:phospholipid-binding lipoprotein MlaA